MAILNKANWDEYLQQAADVHLLQTSAWGELKACFGWHVLRVGNSNAGVQILFRKLPLGFSIAYIPKGPVGKNWENLWEEVHAECKARKAVFLRVEPDENENADFVYKMDGFQIVGDSIQPRQTIIIDLSGSPEEWLSRMKQKTRYNIRLAEKKGIHVHFSQDLIAFEKLMKATGQRDGFGVHTLDYYKKAYELFSKEKKVVLLQADFEEKPLAMVMIFFHGKRAYYLYGASSDEERQRMPAYLLQFKAMSMAAERNCSEYDLWGIPEGSEEFLEEHFENRSDGLWGVYRFKRGFGGRIQCSKAGFDYVYNPLLYRLIRWQMKRSRGINAG